MKVKVGVVGYGTIGKRVADAVRLQPDMELVGVVKTRPDYEARIAAAKGIPVYTLPERLQAFREAGVEAAGPIEDLLSSIDVVVDATPAGVGARYKPVYESHGLRMVFQGGESADVAEVSFNSFCNFDEAVGRRSVRVVSCNTTGLLRIICTLHKLYRVRRVRATIVRRAADPKEVKRGPVNAIVPNPARIPSHHAYDVKTVLPWLDIVTSAVVVPTTLMHVHVVYAELENPPGGVDEVVDELMKTPRIVLVDSGEGVRSTADVVEAARDLGRPRYDIPELVVWRDSITLSGGELYWIQAVHQESIVVPENIDAIRAMTGLASRADESIRVTDETLGLRKGRLF